MTARAALLARVLELEGAFAVGAGSGPSVGLPGCSVVGGVELVGEGFASCSRLCWGKRVVKVDDPRPEAGGDDDWWEQLGSAGVFSSRGAVCGIFGAARVGAANSSLAASLKIEDSPEYCVDLAVATLPSCPALDDALVVAVYAETLRMVGRCEDADDEKFERGGFGPSDIAPLVLPAR